MMRPEGTIKTRNTATRAAIWEAVERAGRPLTPEEILALGKRSKPSLGLATVYRTIRFFHASGKLSEVRLPGEASRYEAAGKHHHHHFHCRNCGLLFEVRGCPHGIERLTPPGFAMESHELTLYGRCVHCR